MTYFYSPSNNGFYNSQLGYDSYPEDVIEITDQQYTELLNGVNVHQKEICVEGTTLSLKDKVITLTWDTIKEKRNTLLAQSDYTQVADWPGDKLAWVAYRQLLRDITQTYENPEDIIWPTPPET